MNNYLATRKKLVNTSSIQNSNWQVGYARNYQSVARSNAYINNSTMQNRQNSANYHSIKVCNRCGFKNHASAINCRNCNTKF